MIKEGVLRRATNAGRIMLIQEKADCVEILMEDGTLLIIQRGKDAGYSVYAFSPPERASPQRPRLIRLWFRLKGIWTSIRSAWRSPWWRKCDRECAWVALYGFVPEADCPVHDPPPSQIDLLANYIMADIPGEPSRDEGAGDCAIRLLKKYRASLGERGEMIDTEILRKVQNAGSIIAIQDGGGRIKIVLEDNVDLVIERGCVEGLHLRVDDTPPLEKADDDSPLAVMSITIWPGQKPGEFLTLLEEAVCRVLSSMR